MCSLNGIPNPTGEKQISSGKQGEGEMEKEAEKDRERKGDHEKDVCTKPQSILGHVEQDK